ncbi:Glycerophosphodiester phosphodiesterase GDPDL3 [Podochytrium sp. JEL0797]|nr:Glycerophosphodiester phosphodiesterase GDPDL3 [Podochytrium sp. JEL0797]
MVFINSIIALAIASNIGALPVKQDNVVDVIARARPATPMIPGWFAERLFHTNAILCPWTTTPLTDEDCQFRRSEITRMRNAIATCEDPLAFNLESIGHRGAALVAPEETIKSLQIAVDSGAGFIECDAAVTKDLQLICRHSVCDLHYTTDILTRPEMAAKCSTPFAPAQNGTAAIANCCTYDFTVKELSSLCSIMESRTNSTATTISTYLAPHPFRSVGIAPGECHKLITHQEYLQFARLRNVNVIPELKDTSAKGTQDFLASKGRTVEFLANRLAKEVKNAGFTTPLDGNFRNATRGTIGILQTFDRRVAKMWKTGKFKRLPVEYMWETGMNASMVEKECPSAADCGTSDVVLELMKLGVEMFSPSINVYVTAENHTIVESQFSKDLKTLAKESGAAPLFGSWSLDRSGCASQLGPNNSTFNAESGLGSIGSCGFYYGSVEGEATFGAPEDSLLMMDTLFTQVGITSLFSDFPATVSMYSNCVLNRKAD